ncbi:MAG: hypothetical protein H6648_01325, partial [Caldilineae bacterium]|nr:hypothetical protein [Caldilineae bacterium]
MKAWQYDADGISTDAAPDQLSDYIIRTDRVDEFLASTGDDNKYFIIAPKGFGKTLLLRAKSQFYRTEKKAYHCLPADSLVERLTLANFDFSYRDLKGYMTLEAWHKIWELTLSLSILRSLNRSVPEEYLSLLGEAFAVSDILRILLQNRGSLDKLYELLPRTLSPKLRSLPLHGGATQIAMFIDNIDEAFARHANASGSHAALDPLVWHSAQNGILRVARDLMVTNKHLKIFVSLRQEAWTNYRSELKLQLEDQIVFLEYKKSEIRRIFENNIAHTAPAVLYDEDATSLLEKFFGYVEQEHKFAKSPDGTPRTEDVFDFVYRHTFGRPREILRIGAELAAISPASDRKPQEVIERVNNVSGALFTQYKSEVVPRFEDEALDYVLSAVNSNVITRDQADAIQNSPEAVKMNSRPISYLWRLGLLGVVKTDPANDSYYQSFQPAGHYRGEEEEDFPPHVEYFVFHSCLDKKLQNLYDSRFYNRDNIIGNRYPFIPPNDSAKGLLHTHVGLSRDSLTIVLPEFAKASSLAILLQPTAEFSQLRGCSKLEIRTSNSEPITLRVLRDDMHESEIAAALAQWRTADSHVLVYSNRDSIVQTVLQDTHGISITDSGDGSIAALRAYFENHPKTPVVYLCQRYRNFSSIKKVRDSIRAASVSSADLRLVLCDRFLYRRSILRESAEQMTLDIEAEEDGRLILRDSSDRRLEPNEIIRRPSNEAEFSAYAIRQLYLVEGVYRLVRILKSQGSPISDESRFADVVTLFCDIQVNRMYASRKFGNQVIRDLFGGGSDTDARVRLREFGEQMIERFSKLDKQDIGLDPRYIQRAKQARMFPNRTEFYAYAEKSPKFYENRAVSSLADVLDIQPLDRYYSVFVSYSYRDEDFALRCLDSLKKRGVSAFCFSVDNPVGDISGSMARGVAER